MELKDTALPMLASAAALLILASLTGSLIFYVAFAVFFIFIAVDVSRLLLSVSSLKRDLSISTSLSRSQLSPGGTAAYSVRAAYGGRMSGIVLSITPLLDDSIMARPPLSAVKLRKGEERSMSLDIVPGKPGDYTAGTVKVRVSSLMFADTLVAGEAKGLRVRLSLGEYMLRPSAVLPRYRNYAASSGGVISKRQGSDFSGVRLYMPGDNVKNIDWALSSRTGEPVVREFEAERKLPAYFLVDMSPAAFEAAAAIVSRLIDRRLAEGEKIGLICFSRSGIVHHIRPGMGREHIRRLSDILSKLTVADDNVSAGPYISISELYDAGRAIGEAAGADVLKPVIEETFKGYIANVREDGFVKAVLAAIGGSKDPCEIQVITGLSMGLPSLMNGLRLAQYYGHSTTVILTASPGKDGERAMELEYAEKKLRAQSVKVRSGYGMDDHEGRINKSYVGG